MCGIVIGQKVSVALLEMNHKRGKHSFGVGWIDTQEKSVKIIRALETATFDFDMWLDTLEEIGVITRKKDNVESNVGTLYWHFRMASVGAVSFHNTQPIPLQELDSDYREPGIEVITARGMILHNGTLTDEDMNFTGISCGIELGYSPADVVTSSDTRRIGYALEYILEGETEEWGIIDEVYDFLTTINRGTWFVVLWEGKNLWHTALAAGALSTDDIESWVASTGGKFELTATTWKIGETLNDVLKEMSIHEKTNTKHTYKFKPSGGYQAYVEWEDIEFDEEDDFGPTSGFQTKTPNIRPSEMVSGESANSQIWNIRRYEPDQGKNAPGRRKIGIWSRNNKVWEFFVPLEEIYYAARIEVHTVKGRPELVLYMVPKSSGDIEPPEEIEIIDTTTGMKVFAPQGNVVWSDGFYISLTQKGMYVNFEFSGRIKVCSDSASK